jgi:hypothetical protein
MSGSFPTTVPEAPCPRYILQDRGCGSGGGGTSVTLWLFTELRESRRVESSRTRIK